MTVQDPFEITIRHRLPLAAAFLSGALLVPASFLALVSPMAMASGPSVSGWVAVLFLLAQPIMLVSAVIAGILCYSRFSRWRFAIALACPALSLIGMKMLDGL